MPNELGDTGIDIGVDRQTGNFQSTKTEKERPTFLRDVEPKHLPTHVALSSQELDDIIELPVLKACKILLEKGVRTSQSGSNQNDLEKGIGGWIVVDPEYLSKENEQIGEELIKEGKAKQIKSRGEVGLLLFVAASRGDETTVQEVETAMAEITSRFKDQPPLGFAAYTLEEMRAIYGYNPTDEISVDRMSEEMGQELYYDESAGIVYLDKAAFEKYRKIDDRLDYSNK